MAKKNKNKTQKEPKEKIIYYDDNSTIADMSNVGRKKPNANANTPTDPTMRKVKPYSTAKDKWKTYWDAVKMMILPMFIVLGVLAVLYLFMMFLLGGF